MLKALITENKRVQFPLRVSNYQGADKGQENRILNTTFRVTIIADGHDPDQPRRPGEGIKSNESYEKHEENEINAQKIRHNA